MACINFVIIEGVLFMDHQSPWRSLIGEGVLAWEGLGCVLANELVPVVFPLLIKTICHKVTHIVVVVACPYLLLVLGPT